MAFSFANWMRCVVVAGVALAATCPVCAQSAGRRPGQPILFSSPDDQDVSSNTPSLTARPPGALDFANVIQSPSQGSGIAPGVEPLPAPPMPTISPAQAQQMQRLLDERKNWALLTPEQILNPPTQEKILDIADRNIFGQPKNETVVMQYVKRQDQLLSGTNNFNFGHADPVSRRGFSDNMEPQIIPNYWNPAGGRPGNSGLIDQIIGRTPDSRGDATQPPKNIWQKSFDLPAQEPKPTPEQQDAMNQFQALLQPHPLSGGAAKAPSFGTPTPVAPATAPKTAAGQAPAISIGASFTPLSSGVTMPAGLTPLPGLLGPTNTGLPALVPEWKPQPPPWQSSTPQMDVMPQRKF